MAKNVKILKLITGEEILAEVIKNYDTVTIKNVLRIVIMPSRDPSAPTVGLAGWAQFSKDDEITIDKSHIIAIMDPIDQFVEQYRQQFSGLVTPSSQLII